MNQAIKTPADEIKAEIARCDGELRWNEECIDELEQRIGRHRRNIDDLIRQRARLQRQLEREVAVMRKTQPLGVKAGAFDV